MSTTLIDNIMMSLDLYDKQKSCVILNDLSNYLPCLSIIRNCLLTVESNLLTVSRKLNGKKLDEYRDILNNVDWSDISDNCNVNEIMHEFITS